MSSTWGNRIRLTLFGESHGSGVGCVLDGLPAGKELDLSVPEKLLTLRSASDLWDTPRREKDSYKIVSGMTGGKTNGFPLTVLFGNNDAVRTDERLARPSHAEYAMTLRYGRGCDISGGGHLSARLTLPMVFAGGVCESLLSEKGIKVETHILRTGNIEDLPFAEDCEVRKVKGLNVIDPEAGEKMAALLAKCREEGDSVSGMVECRVSGVPGGMGDPVFEGADSLLAALMFAIPAVKSFEIGDGTLTQGFGSELNDAFECKEGVVRTSTNHSGGMNGGITNGMPLIFRVGFRPIPSIAKAQRYLDLNEMKTVMVTGKTRSDVCAAVRGNAVVHAAAALCVYELYLRKYAFGEC